METTENYKLPQWVKADQIRMDDFNDAFGKIESALSGHDEALDGKASTSSVTAVQQEVAAAREANCLLKLAGPLVTTAANAAMEFDLSQVDMTKVAALLVVSSSGSTSGSMSLFVNGTGVALVGSNNFSTGGGFAWLVPLPSGAACFSMSANTKNSSSSSNGCGVYTAAAWEDISSVSLRGTYDAGASAVLFGVKK